MSIGDINSEEVGSGARYNDGKADWSLMPLHLLEGTVRVWMYGAKKYAAWNWAKGMAWSVPYACALRHLISWYRGEEVDPESGESHLDHVICNIMMLKQFEESYREGDDRPPKKMFGVREEEREVRRAGEEEAEAGEAGFRQIYNKITKTLEEFD